MGFKFSTFLCFIYFCFSSFCHADIKLRLQELEGGYLEYIDIGSGEFTIVVESGIGMGTQYWLPVLPELKKLNQRVIIYSRAGIGESANRSNVSLRSSNKRLKALLGALNIQDNIILLGHSYGGLHARQYAAAYSEQVKGLVLLDPSHEAFLSELNRLNFDWSQRDNQKLNKIMHQSAEWQVLQHQYTKSTMLDKGKISMVPTVIVSSSMEGESDWWIGHSTAGKTVWRTLHASLIVENPNSMHLVSSSVSHNIPLDDPKLVVSAISILVEML
ncbi:alpha/beta hydrolase [Pseudoalteromonas luteoviolacea]|uniref:alpha/beta fold hydrolase n=1 Tax=Pseudoalteromonas luteoviolacea TaxID=43657 RepID=UPI001B3A1829|nr:alpha/beta hydrolase [Pseudoalteromonas luteoviolacea]MBQ4878653.1 alpha/beta hydrolase [Pseudoalteromonas luteoviolacea]MBQ4907193.1 alpha/beta hydrolase [Pseudoalteromonas luteoviolacea]